MSCLFLQAEQQQRRRKSWPDRSIVSHYSPCNDSSVYEAKSIFYLWLYHTNQVTGTELTYYRREGSLSICCNHCTSHNFPDSVFRVSAPGVCCCLWQDPCLLHSIWTHSALNLGGERLHNYLSSYCTLDSLCHHATHQDSLHIHRIKP